MQSIMRLQRQDVGARADHLLKGHFYIPPARYARMRAAITRFADQLGQRVRALPGVISASVTTLYPPESRWTQFIEVAGRPHPRIEEIPTSQFGVADAALLRTLAIPLLRGRDFSETETATSPTVALITGEFRRRFFAEEDPIGRQVHIGPPPGVLGTVPGSNTWDFTDVTIIGVIGDIKNAGLAAPAKPEIVCLYSQHPAVNYGFKDIVIRTAVEPHSIEPAVRSQIHDLDADMVFAEVETMDEMIADQTGGQRFITMLLSLFTAAEVGAGHCRRLRRGVLSRGTAKAGIGCTGGARGHAARRPLAGAAARLEDGCGRRGDRRVCGAWSLRPLIGRFLFGISPA